MQANKVPQAQKILRYDVSKEEIARAYLYIELRKLFDGSSDAIVQAIAKLHDSDLWHMVQAFSSTLHQNYVFWELSNESYTWNEEVWAMEDVMMSGINPGINVIIDSPEIRRSPVKFAKYIKTYFATHTHNDQLKLREFIAREAVQDTRLLAVKTKTGVLLRDGSHRAVAMAQMNVSTALLFVGYSDSSCQQKMQIGDEVFVLLRNIYNSSLSGEDKQGILRTVYVLASRSVEGKEAVRKWWITYAPGSDSEKAGSTVLEMLGGDESG